MEIRKVSNVTGECVHDSRMEETESGSSFLAKSSAKGDMLDSLNLLGFGHLSLGETHCNHCTKLVVRA